MGNQLAEAVTAFQEAQEAVTVAQRAVVKAEQEAVTVRQRAEQARLALAEEIVNAYRDGMNQTDIMRMTG